MAIPKNVKSEEILDRLSALDISVREILTEVLREEDADLYLLNLMPAAVLNMLLVELRQRAQVHANA